METARSTDIDGTLKRLERKLQRERLAREEAERLLEEKSSELYSLNGLLQTQVRDIEVLRHSIDMATDGIALTDGDGAFIYMNPAHAGMFAYTVEELLGQSWTILYGEAENERLGEIVFPRLQSEGTWRGETYGLSKTGFTIIQEIVLTLLPSGGLICATRDISARRKREIYARDLEGRLQKAEREAALFTLGNAVAHDFNNLIAAISGNAAMLKTALRNDFDNYHRVNQIEIATRQAANVIRSLNIERSNDTQNLAPIDLAELIQTGLQIAEAIKPKGIQVITDIPVEAEIISNEVVVTRCLLNIVKNAFEAMNGVGTVTLRVATTCSVMALADNVRTLATGVKREDPIWIVEITDTGSGVPENKLDHIFEDFFTTKPKLGGSGLGLQALRTLADSGNVFVEVETAKNVGTRFRLSFYKDVLRADPSLPIRSLRTEGQSKPRAGLRILLVDDNALVGRMLEDALLQMKFLPDWINDPRAVLRLIESAKKPYDLIITDLSMPYIDGQNLSRQIRSIRPDLPIIIYSGQASLIEPSSIYAAILQKPIGMDALGVAIRNAVSKG